MLNLSPRKSVSQIAGSYILYTIKKSIEQKSDGPELREELETCYEILCEHNKTF